MTIERLHIEGFRNIRCIDIGRCGRVNIITGQNGSGKTSTLDAIYYLAHMRVPSSPRADALIGFDAPGFLITADVCELGLVEAAPVGVSRSRDGELVARLNHQAASRSELAAKLPILAINGSTLELITGARSLRRKLIDWGLFHVKPGYLSAWRRVQKLMLQRSLLIKQLAAGQQGVDAQNIELDGWEKQLVEAAEHLDACRGEYTAALIVELNTIMLGFSRMPEFKVAYRRGWPDEVEFVEYLRSSRRAEAESGRSRGGSQHATLELSSSGRQAAEVLSRGQQKLVAAAMKLAQGSLLRKMTGRQPIYLLDDLPAELDAEHREELSRVLDKMDAQVFVTGVDADQLEGFWAQQPDIRLFHVERGELHEQQR